MAMLTSIMTGGVNNHPTTSDEANAWSTDFVSEGIVGSFSSGPPLTGAFATTAQGSPDMTVAVATGVCYVQGTPTSQSSQTFRIKNTASENVTIAANSSGSTKYDWVYIKLDATKLNGPNVAGDDAATLTTSRSTSQSSDDGTPPTYGYPIAVVTVANGATSITSGNIRDSRANCIVNLGSSSVSSGWTDLGYSPNTVTALGNRSYSLVFNSTDLTGTTSVGQRLKLPRTVTAPTGSITLNGTTQDATKASPSGVSFTGDHSYHIKIKPTAYQSGYLFHRMTGANTGFAVLFNSTGQIQIQYGNGASLTQIQTYQSVPLNKVSEISIAVSVAAKTAVVLLDKTSVPTYLVAGTATTVVQPAAATALRIGSDGTSYFKGQIAQAALFTTAVASATLIGYQNQTLTGSETSLVSAYKLDQASGLNDLSANANNLTANGSPTYSTTEGFFTNPVTGTSVTAGTTNYGIIMAQTFSTNTTYTVQIPEGETLPTTGGIGTVSYSTQKTPYGFPGDESKWEVGLYLLSTVATSGTVTSTIYNPGGLNINIPVGSWNTDFESVFSVTTAGGGIDLSTTLSTSSTAATGATTNFSARTLIGIASTAASRLSHSRSGDIAVTTATPYYLLIVSNAAFSTLAFEGTVSSLLNTMTQVVLRTAYL